MPNQNTLLTREQTARALSAAGFPVALATLAAKATRGGGPPFRRFGVRTLCDWGTSLAWAEARLSRQVTRTSEFYGDELDGKAA
jgi:hypothetical protein